MWCFFEKEQEGGAEEVKVVKGVQEKEEKRKETTVSSTMAVALVMMAVTLVMVAVALVMVAVVVEA